MPEIVSRSDARVAPVDQVAHVVSEFAALTWPLPDREVPALVERLGWTVIPGAEGKYLEADTGWRLNQNAADFSSDNHELTNVSFRVTDVILADVPWRSDFLDDAFTIVLGFLTSQFGPPTATERGSRPYGHRDLINHGRVAIARIKSSVTANGSSAEWAEVNRRLGA